MIVLDASALLAFLFREAGSDRVAQHIGSGVMSTVNLSEVLARFARDGHDIRPIRDRLLASPIEWITFDKDHAAHCAALLPLTKPLGLSLADRACLSLGRLRRAPVLTADRAWLDLQVDVEVRSIR